MVVLECLNTRRPDLTTEILPIVLKTVKNSHFFSIGDRSDDPQIISHVYPFTRSIIDAHMRNYREWTYRNIRGTAFEKWNEITDVPFFGLRGRPSESLLE